MQMGGGAQGDLQSEINITPLVDVVLVLLIIFMVVVPLLLKGYDANIARTSADGPPAQSAEEQVILSIVPAGCHVLEPPGGDGLPADCHVTLGEQVIPASDLPQSVEQMLGGRPVEKRVLFLAVDSTLNYEAVLRIVDLAKSRVDDLTIEFLTTD